MVAIVEKTNFPLQNQWLTTNIVYQVNASNNANNKKRIYLGLFETPSKRRSSNHERDGKDERYSNATELSNMYGN